MRVSFPSMGSLPQLFRTYRGEGTDLIRPAEAAVLVFVPPQTLSLGIGKENASPSVSPTDKGAIERPIWRR